MSRQDVVENIGTIAKSWRSPPQCGDAECRQCRALPPFGIPGIRGILGIS